MTTDDITDIPNEVIKRKVFAFSPQGIALRADLKELLKNTPYKTSYEKEIGSNSIEPAEVGDRYTLVKIANRVRVFKYGLLPIEAILTNDRVAVSTAIAGADIFNGSEKNKRTLVRINNWHSLDEYHRTLDIEQYEELKSKVAMLQSSYNYLLDNFSTEPAPGLTEYVYFKSSNSDNSFKLKINSLNGIYDLEVYYKITHGCAVKLFLNISSYSGDARFPRVLPLDDKKDTLFAFETVYGNSNNILGFTLYRSYKPTAYVSYNGVSKKVKTVFYSPHQFILWWASNLTKCRALSKFSITDSSIDGGILYSSDIKLSELPTFGENHD